jgi:hypothetical protein
MRAVKAWIGVVPITDCLTGMQSVSSLSTNSDCCSAIDRKELFVDRKLEVREREVGGGAGLPTMLSPSSSDVSDSSELSAVVAIETGSTFAGGVPLVAPTRVFVDDIVTAAAALSASERT